MGPLDEVCGRRPERRCDEVCVVCEQHVEERRHALRVDPHATDSPSRRVVVGRRWHVVASEQLVDPVPVLLGKQLDELAAIETALVGARELLGHQQVDAERLSLHLLLDPAEVDVELLGGVRDGTEDAAPACVGHRRDDVAAVAEAEDGDVDADEVSGRCAHRTILLVTVLPRDRRWGSWGTVSVRRLLWSRPHRVRRGRGAERARNDRRLHRRRTSARPRGSRTPPGVGPDACTRARPRRRCTAGRR